MLNKKEKSIVNKHLYGLNEVTKDLHTWHGHHFAVLFSLVVCLSKRETYFAMKERLFAQKKYEGSQHLN